MSEEGTIFDKIISGDIPAYKIYEDDKCLAFLDIMPIGRGHTLVIPKENYVDIFDIPDELMSHIGIVISKVAKLLKEKLGADGCNIFQNTGTLAGQVVMHYHMHIVPRYKGDGVKLNFHESASKSGELEEIYKEIVE